MNRVSENTYLNLKYYEIKNEKQPLVLLHAQGVDSTSFDGVWSKLSKKYHVYAVDYYGHGGSLHEPERYNISDIGNAVIDFIKNTVKSKVFLLGHSSGGLIAAYVASHCNYCEQLILEDPPFFASQGERRKTTFNYIDLSTICHEFINQSAEKDFVLYYFCRQYAWNFFPQKSRNKIQKKMTEAAKKYRKSYPERNLKVPFWPKAALSAYKGMNSYDPYFGEAFYNDSFHSGIPHAELLQNISCKTLFMKAETNFGSDGVLLAALNDNDVQNAEKLIPNCTVVRFECGHSIHTEKPRKFISELFKLV